MAAYLRNNVCVSCLMFLVMIGSLNAQVADKKAICGKTKNPSFCERFMNDRPMTSRANIQTLATITYGSAQNSASRALTKIEPLVMTTTNPALRRGYFSCVVLYKSAVSILNEGMRNLASGNGPGMKIKVSVAMEGATKCQIRLAKVKADPSVVKENGDFQNICDILLVISPMMTRF